MCSTSHDAHFLHGQSDDDATLVDDHQIVIICNILDSHQATGLLCDRHGLDTLTATVGLTVVFHHRALAVAVLTDDHHCLGLCVVDNDHTDHSIVALIETHTTYTGRHTAHATHIVLVEADSLTIAVGHDQFVMSIGQTHVDHLVTFEDVDGLHTIGTRT